MRFCFIRMCARTAAAIAIACAAHAQSFEAASVKPAQNLQQRLTGPNIQPTPGNLSMQRVNLASMIMWAYKISPQQVSNASVLSGDFYDVVAKAAGPAKVEEMRVMMQSLLADRFKLQFHHETKEMRALVLTAAKDGPKLKPSAVSDGPGIVPAINKVALTGLHASMDQLAIFLSGPLGTPVVDDTGLKDFYDFDFDLTPFLPAGPPQPGEAPPDPVAIFQAALPKLLGLHLESRKMPVDMVVIDHIEKLTEN